MRDAGAAVTMEDVYRVEAPQTLKPADIQTYPYPGFPTDLQAPFTTVMTQAHGNSSIHETMFEDRLRYISELRKMGASIDASESGRTAMVHGPTPLRGASVCAMESAAAEQSARFRAMDAASANLTRIIDELTLSYHTARQHAITMEMLDLTAGSGILRGPQGRR